MAPHMVHAELLDAQVELVTVASPQSKYLSRHFAGSDPFNHLHEVVFSPSSTYGTAYRKISQVIAIETIQRLLGFARHALQTQVSDGLVITLEDILAWAPGIEMAQGTFTNTRGHVKKVRLSQIYVGHQS